MIKDKRSGFTGAVLLLSVFVLSCVAAIEDDVLCLEGIKSSLSDPYGRLSVWDFTNTSISHICNLEGVTCWNLKENRLISLRLSSFGLSGRLPESLKYCHSLQYLYLSGNSLSGPIPSQICSWLPYLVTLDLSNNSLSGSIPPQIVNCKFLNDLILNYNSLSGSIPYEVDQLERLKQLSVAGNDLSGAIPVQLSKFGAEAFAGNSRLCGKPLGSCGGLRTQRLAVIIVAGIVGAAGSLILGFVIWICFNRPNRGYGATGGKEDSNWIEFLRAYKLVQVSLFQKPLVKIKLAHLLAATNSFDPCNIVSSNKSGVSYRAVLSDGSVLAVKRLTGCNLSEKHFRSEMNRMGQLRHPNLVPLLGYCVVEEEKLLVYKHMHNGTLHSRLHEKEYGPNGTTSSYCPLDWPIRLRLGLGAARGLAWLHHGLEPPCPHGNFGSNVILLDDDLEARLTDFGLMRLVGMDDGPGTGLIQEMEMGKLGYRGFHESGMTMASLRGDVYSFGVLLLELVTGQKPPEVSNADGVYKGSLVDWVSQLSVLGPGTDAIDRPLRGRGYDQEINDVMRVACSCVVSRLKNRPSMHRVYESLKLIGDKHAHAFSELDEEFPMMFGR